MIPQFEEFKLSKYKNLIFRIDNGVLQGRTDDAFTWTDVVSFTIEDIKEGKAGCLECFQR